MNSSEKVFCEGNMQFSWKDCACRRTKCQSEIIGRHIHHALYSHGGERAITINKQEILVDGYNPETSTVYQFSVCYWHGCPCLGSNNNYQKTLNLENRIRNSGYNVVSFWECENPGFSGKRFQHPHYIGFETLRL